MGNGPVSETIKGVLYIGKFIGGQVQCSGNKRTTPDEGREPNKFKKFFLEINCHQATRTSNVLSCIRGVVCIRDDDGLAY